MAEEVHNGRSDHDLLITINTQLERAVNDIKDLSKNVIDSSAQLRESKLEKDVFNRWETDFRREFEKEINLLKDNLVDDLTKINKTYTDGYKDHEERLRRIEKYVWTAIGGLLILQIVIGFVK